MEAAAAGRERPFLSQAMVNGRAVICSLFIFLPLLVINALQTVSLVFKPFSRRMFRSINRKLARFYWTLLVWLMTRVYRVRIEWHSDELPPGEDVIVMANHQSAVDVMPLFALASRCDRIGDVKFFVKEVFKYIPGPGWGMVFLDCIFLKRRWMADRRRLKSTFERFRAERIPLWLNIFPEGTRYSPGKLAEAHKTARHYKLPLCQHVLVPYSKAFELSFMSLQDRVQAVYDITIGYPQGIPSLWQLLCGDVKVIEVQVSRFPLAALPANAAGIETWLHERFWAKEQRLTRLQKEGAWINDPQRTVALLALHRKKGWTAS